jgi:Right handed beta helix region
VTWCETGLPTSPYPSAPTGSVTVPAGDNGSFNFSTPDTTYWFAPGIHTLGSGSDGQIQPADGDTYIGAPGAVLNGQNVNRYAFIGNYQDLGNEDVTIEYLTIENFHPDQGSGAVNGNGDNGWTEKYDLMKDNSPGAAMMLGGNNVVSDNCLTANGEYGFNGYSYVDETYGSTFTGGATNITFTDNDVSDNNTQRTSSGIEGGGKFWQDGDVVVTGNYVHGNIDSPGLWMDTDNAGFLVQGNYFANNDEPGLMYEISYNADIIDNTFVDNALPGGEGNKGFPTGAIYISESGGNASVPSTYAGELNIQGNLFNDNWDGVVIYQNANRYVGDGQDPGTLTPPSGTNVDTWINDAPDVCSSHLSETSPVDYNSLCQWRSQNVTVQDNTFEFNPSDSIFGGQCTEANACGQNALFSVYSSTSAYPVWSICNNISNDQNNHFANNTYTGSWTFTYFNQGDMEGPSAWQAGASNVESSGHSFGAQDVGSTFTS